MKSLKMLFVGAAFSIVVVVGFVSCDGESSCGTASSESACASKCSIGTIYTYNYSTGECCCHS